MRKPKLPGWVRDDLNSQARDFFNQVLEQAKQRALPLIIAAIPLGGGGAAYAADAANIELPIVGQINMIGGPEEPQRSAGIYDVLVGDDGKTVFAKISNPAPMDPQNTLILNVISDMGDINVIDLRTGGTAVVTGLQVASLTPGTDFDCDTLAISNSQIPKLNIAMKAWASVIRDNIASGNDHTFNMTDLGSAYAVSRPVVPVNAYGLGTLDVSGDYDKVEINVATAAVVGRISIDALGIRDGLFSVVDAHCGSIVVRDNLIGEGSGVAPADPKDFITVIDIDSGGTHTVTGNIESDIKLR